VKISFCALMLLLTWLAQADEEDEPLPKWSSEDSQRVLAGEFLASDILFNLLEQDDGSGQASNGLELPELGPENQDLVVPTEISAEDLVEFFSQKSNSLLIDPQKLLSLQEYGDCLSFLEYHESDSNIDLVVYIFDKEQVIPPVIKIDEVFAQYQDKERPAVLVFYYLGAPERAEVHLSPSILRSVGESERLRALQSSINQAVVKSQQVDQLDGFCVQISARIYWMERAMKAGVVVPVQQVQFEEGQQPNQAKVGAAKLWLNQWMYPLVLGFGVVLVALIFGWIRRARAKFLFAEFDIAPRLGGAHAAGVGAVISYASSKMPPVLQREQVPNYLRRM